jgi:hypothetical protein
VAALHAYETAVRDDSTYTKAVKNAERLRTIVSDSTATDEVTVQDLAEAFRTKVKMWKDTTTPKGGVEVKVKPDTGWVSPDTTEIPPTTGDPRKG